MKRHRSIRRRLFIALALAIFTAGVVAVPLLVGMQDRQTVFRGVAVLAGGADRFILSEPIALLETPGITLESGTVAVVRTRGQDASRDREGRPVLAPLSGQLALENAIIRVDLSRSGPALQRAGDDAGNSGANGTDAEGAVNRALAPMLEALVRYNFKTLSLRDCTVLLAAGSAPAYRFEDVQFDIGVEKGVAITANGKLLYRGERLQVKGRLGLGELKTGLKRLPLRTTFSGGLVSASFDGHFVFGARPQFLAKQAQLKLTGLGAAARWLGLTWPDGTLNQDFSVTGDLDWTSGTIAFHGAKFQLGKNKANGTLSLNYSVARPVVEGTIAARDLDLAGYFNASTQDTARSVIQPSAWLANLGVRTGTSLNSGLRGIDADLRVSADRVSGLGIEMGRSAATISLRAGKLLADLAEVEFPAGGKGSVQVSFDVNGAVPKIGVRGRLLGIEVSQAMMIGFGHQVLSGKGDVVVDVTGAGGSRFEFFKTMNGKVTLNVPGPSKLALDLDVLFKKNHDEIDKPGWGAALSGRTVLKEVVAKLAFVNGIAHTDGVSGIAGGVIFWAAGEIEFPSKALDLKISIADHVAGTQRVAAPHLERGRVVLHASGHWARPNVISSDHASRQP